MGDIEFNNEDWLEFDTYWVSKHQQYSPQWFNLREKNILTASNFGNASGHGYEAPDVLAYRLKNKISIPQNKAMQHGTNTEHLARKWYCERFNVEIIERGLAIPKWYTKIGASTDGEIINSEGLIEIKCPQKMYKKLVTNTQLPIHERIVMSHYDQIQGSLAILNKKWCDYIVFSTGDNQVYVEKIHFDDVYWNNDLFPKLKLFVEKNLSTS